MNTRKVKIPKVLHKLLSFYALLERNASQIVFIFNEVMIVQSGKISQFTIVRQLRTAFQPADVYSSMWRLKDIFNICWIKEATLKVF